MRGLVFAAMTIVSTLVTSACASINVNALPQPGAFDSDGYDIVMKFESVLNLPERAKVVLDGITVGVVSGMTLTHDDVDVTARVNRGVAIPSNIHAVLEQATVLGDIYVALERPQDGGPQAVPLSPGAAIPLAQTTSPPQLEDTIASFANFVSSGSIQRAQNTVIRLNRVIPASDEVRRLTHQVDANLRALSMNIDQVDALLDGVSRTADTLNAHIPEVEYQLSPYGQRGMDRTIAITNYVSTLLPAVGSISAGGYWLVPFLNSLADSVGAIQQSKVAVESEVPKYRRLFTDFFLPEDKYPAINITSIVGPDGRELSGNVQDVLRILGAMP
ncbi:MlaD family protein [Mycobacterium intracellulare]|uniref:Mce family protein n=1 Tax=Mycobacterium intracellulare subsp. chimaera TaxID=222805 RepID=A0A7U5MQ22_MYCIT|nr:MlaD family protein [Mycobacterium intracellulare]ASL17542.1 Mce family protein [Mycobacterium intracellulare subsp. chimaera]MDM3929477.1 MlaD family protein [Mycobacterium intracellulare subsp. chimaera]